MAECTACAWVTDDLWWGEAGPGGDDRPEPAGLATLESLPFDRRRCPACGSLFDLVEEAEGLMCFEWTSRRLRRLSPSATSPDVRSLEVAGAGGPGDPDLEGLRAADPAVARAALEELVRLLDDPAPAVRARAAKLLGKAVARGSDPGGALPRLVALVGDAQAGDAAVGALLSVVRAGRAVDAGPLVAAASERLRERNSACAVRLLEELSDRGADVSPALPALAGCSGNALSFALAFLEKLAGTGADLTAAEPALRRLAERPRDERSSWEEAQALRVLVRHLAFRAEWTALSTLLQDPSLGDEAGTELLRVSSLVPPGHAASLAALLAAAGRPVRA